MKTIEVIPDPTSLLESMRAVGYTLETAIADLIDNSITAKASSIEVAWDPTSNPYLAILDDGIGMDAVLITNAMRHGNHKDKSKRDLEDLGRFGLGLKTASLSQCRKLTVISKKDGDINLRCWDLDIVAEKSKWIITIPNIEDYERVLILDKFKKLKSGTLVIWENLDRIISGSTDHLSEITEKISPLSDHLALVFHRYINPEFKTDQKVIIKLNGHKVHEMDPFLRKLNYKQSLEGQKIKHPLGLITVTPHILPPISHLTKEDIELAGGREGLRSSQGFYIYRNKRLLIWGTWFKLINKDEFYKLARIQVDIPNTFDELWSLDIKKSTAYPPVIIRNRLKELLPYFAGKSKKTITYSGRKSIIKDEEVVWDRVEMYHKIRYIPNQNNKIIANLISKLDAKNKKVLAILFEVLASNLPMQTIYADMSSDDSYQNCKNDIEEVVGNIKKIMEVTSIKLEVILKMEPYIEMKSMHQEIRDLINKLEFE
jgi:hypothetical protein